MRIAIPILLAATLLPAVPGEARPSFDALKAKATPISDLGHFLETYVGDCKNPLEKRECEKNAATHRKAMRGHLLYAMLPDRMSRLLRLGRDLGGGRVRIMVTPMFGASGYGLTRGRPHHLDRGGHPRVGLLPITGHLPDGMDLRSLNLAIQTENVRIELLFVPRRPWHLHGHGHSVEGVSATFKGLRISSARTGGEIASVVW